MMLTDDLIKSHSQNRCVVRHDDGGPERPSCGQEGTSLLRDFSSSLYLPLLEKFVAMTATNRRRFVFIGFVFLRSHTDGRIELPTVSKTRLSLSLLYGSYYVVN